MALDLHFAAEADQLKGILLGGLRNVWNASPLSCPTIIVPNPAVKRWLTLQMAREFGAVLGPEITTLERAIWNWLKPDPNMRRLDATSYQQILAKLLQPDHIQSAIYEPVRKYIGDNDSLRRLQLAGFLSNLFLEYEYNRPSVWKDGEGWVLPGIDASWLAGKPYAFTRDVAELVRAQEQWQMDLYRRSMQMLESMDAEERLISLPHLHRLRCEQGWKVSAGHVNLFLVSKISHWHRNLLVYLSQMPGTDIHVYLTNPCAEFWEDVNTRSSRNWRRKWNVNDTPSLQGIRARTPEEYRLESFKDNAFSNGDPRLLELWGHSARENIALWCPVAEWNFEYHEPDWLDKEGESLSCLRSMQRSLLRREADLPAGTKSDLSLQVLNAPDVGREVEELREQILDAVEQGVVKRLEDVVVYVTDLSAYLPHIERVFGAYHRWDPECIAYRIFGAPGGGSLYAQAVHALLDILNGRYDRAALFTLFRNPIWQASQGVQGSELPVWESWAASTGMIRGYDAEHRKMLGDLGDAASESHTFSLGVYRLLLGSVANGPVDLGYGCPVSGFRDYETSDTASLERFVGALESMYALSTSKVHEDLAQALAFVEQEVERFLSRIPDDAEWNPMGEERVRQSFLEALRTAQKMASRVGYGACTREELMSVVNACLPEELNPGSKAWMGGITFATLRMGMVLPHQMICVLGLGAKEFPGTKNTSVLDLLGNVRIVGDSHPIRDNQLAFLEVVHAAKNRLLLSFRGKNLQKQEDLQPSSVILELLDYLRGQGGIDPQRKLALGIWDGARHWNKRAKLVRAASSLQRAMHRFPNHLGTASFQKERANATIPLRHVVEFLKNPLAFHLEKTLGIKQEDDPSALEVAEEPLAMSNLQKAALEKRIWELLLKQVFPEQPGECLQGNELRDWVMQQAERICSEAELAGEFPLAPFSSQVRKKLFETVEKAIKGAEKLRQSYPDHVFVTQTDLSLGRAGQRASLDLGTFTIQVPLQLVLVPRDVQYPIAVLKLEKSGKATENLELLWNSYCLALMYPMVHAVQLEREKGDFSFAACKEFTTDLRKKVTEYLLDLVTDMVGGGAEHLPFSHVQKIYQTLNKNGEADITKIRVNMLEELEQGRFTGYRSFNGAWDLVESRFPPEEELTALIQRRMQPILEGWFHG